MTVKKQEKKIKRNIIQNRKRMKKKRVSFRLPESRSSSSNHNAVKSSSDLFQQDSSLRNAGNRKQRTNHERPKLKYRKRTVDPKSLKYPKKGIKKTWKPLPYVITKKYYSFWHEKYKEYPNLLVSDCWYCCHSFDSPPLGIPLHLNETKREVGLHGVFCSVGCMVRYNEERIQHHNNTTLWNMTWCIREMRHALKKKRERLEELKRDGKKEASESDMYIPDFEYPHSIAQMHGGKHFSLLKKFGGPLEIEEFRADESELNKKASEVIQYMVYRDDMKVKIMPWDYVVYIKRKQEEDRAEEFRKTKKRKRNFQQACKQFGFRNFFM